MDIMDDLRPTDLNIDDHSNDAESAGPGLSTACTSNGKTVGMTPHSLPNRVLILNSPFFTVISVDKITGKVKASCSSCNKVYSGLLTSTSNFRVHLKVIKFTAIYALFHV